MNVNPAPAAPWDELVLKVVLASQVPGADVHAVIQAHRRYLIEEMQRCRVSAGPDLNLASSAELFRLDSLIRWLDTADRRVGWVSDADRDLTTARLGEHFAAGRLSQAELNERLTAALTAQTARELRGPLADLP